MIRQHLREPPQMHLEPFQADRQSRVGRRANVEWRAWSHCGRQSGNTAIPPQSRHIRRHRRLLLQRRHRLPRLQRSRHHRRPCPRCPRRLHLGRRSRPSSDQLLSRSTPPLHRHAPIPPHPLTQKLSTASRQSISHPSSILCFHARNIPSISIEAYLQRILKYCPITNEVFLSLLVYFDRMSRAHVGSPAALSSSQDSKEGVHEGLLSIRTTCTVWSLPVSQLQASSFPTSFTPTRDTPR